MRFRPRSLLNAAKKDLFPDDLNEGPGRSVDASLRIMSTHYVFSGPNEPIQIEQLEPYQPGRLLPCLNKVRSAKCSKERTVAKLDSRSAVPQETQKYQYRKDKPNQPFQNVEPVVAGRESEGFLRVIGPPDPDKYDVE